MPQLMVTYIHKRKEILLRHFFRFKGEEFTIEQLIPQLKQQLQYSYNLHCGYYNLQKSIVSFDYTDMYVKHCEQSCKKLRIIDSQRYGISLSTIRSSDTDTNSNIRIPEYYSILSQNDLLEKDGIIYRSYSLPKSKYSFNLVRNIFCKFNPWKCKTQCVEKGELETTTTSKFPLNKVGGHIHRGDICIFFE
jgi:hypothetical protein